MKRFTLILLLSLGWLYDYGLFGQAYVECEAWEVYYGQRNEEELFSYWCDLARTIRRAEYQNAEQISEQARKLLGRTEDSLLVAQYLLTESELFRLRYNLFQAAENYQEAISILEKLNLTEQLAFAKIGLAEFYRSTEQYELAKLELDYVLSMDSIRGNFSPKTLARAYHRLAAIAYEFDHDPEKAVELSLTSLSYSEPIDLLDYMGTSYNELGAAYASLFEYDKAVLYLKKASKIWMQLNRPHYHANSLMNMTRIVALNDQDRALVLLDELLELCEKHELGSVAYLALQEKAKILFSKGDIKGAYLINDSGSRMYLEMLQKQHNTELSDVSARYQNETTMNRLIEAELEKEKARQQTESDRLRLTFVGIGLGAAILSILVLFSLYGKLQSHSRSIEKQRSIIEKQNKILADALKQKDTLLQEVHHRVKNNLQFIMALVEMQIGGDEKEDKATILSDISRRISAISIIHERLYDTDDLENVSVREYIESIIRSMKKLGSTQDSNVEYELKIDQLRLGISKGICVGMIISELITNSKKYAFEDREDKRININLSYNAEKREAELVYSDNGTGLDNNVKLGLGSRLIDMFSRQLKGKYEYNSSSGLTFVLNFPCHVEA